MARSEIDDVRIAKPRVYTVPKYDIESLNEIKKMIRENMYSDAKQIREHLNFLESTAGRLNKILTNEQQEGLVDLDTPNFVRDVKQTYDQLYHIYEKLLNKLHEKHKEIQKKKPRSAIIRGLSSGSFGSSQY